jgi:hypothetical protein
MVKNIRAFFATVLARESLPSRVTGLSAVRQSFLPDLVRGEKLGRRRPEKGAGGGFVSKLLAPETLPVAKIRRNLGRTFISNMLTNDKIPSGPNHNE